MRLTLVALALLLAGCASLRPETDSLLPPATAILPAATPTTTPRPLATATAVVLDEPDPTEQTPAEPLPGAEISSPTVTPGAPGTLSAALPGVAEGFELVGHTALNSSGWHAGVALKDACAYVGNRRSGSVAIVDVSDPAAPTPIGAIPFGPQGQPIDLRTLPERNLLVVSDLGSRRLFTFDVSDCAAPQPLSALDMPGAPHEFYLWDDGERVLLFGAMFDQSDADLIVVDLTEPAAPTAITRWTAADEGVAGLLHSLSLSPDGRRAYLAMWNGGVLVADLALPGLPSLRVLRDGTGNPRPAAFVAAHSATPLQNSDPPTYLLVTTELWVCPFSGAYIVSIADPGQPYLVTSLELPESGCEGRPADDAIYNAHNPLVVGDLVFFSWFAGGVQALDVSNPQEPRRVAQFVPAGEGSAPQSYVGSYPVQTWSYPILRDGLLYVADIQSGLYILRYTGPGTEDIAAVSWAEANVMVGQTP